MDFRLSNAQTELQARARELARGAIAARAAEVDRSEQYPWENIRMLVEHGLVGLTIPEAYGGHGRSYLDAVLVIEEMAQVCGVTGRIAVETNMGAIGAIMAYGSEDQRRLAADLVLAGDKPAICITEPEAGSAATAMTTRADRRGSTYVLNGKKHWITGGGVSRLHLVFARVFDERGEPEGIGGFLIVRGETSGLRIGVREPTMGLRGIPETEVHFEDLEIPASRRLPSPRGPARGFADLMDAYNAQRVGAATVALGLAQGAFELARDYALEREQFGRPIAEFQGMQWSLADMHMKTMAARTMVYRAAVSGGAFPDPLEAAVAKIQAAEAAIEVTNAALQVFGARGYSRHQPLERMVRDARMFTIGGGTVQVLRNVVASRVLNQPLPQTRDGYLKRPLRRDGPR
ncbi:MAG: acyl-CoA dehydrogenase [Alphaproteobacteria bacterium]|nr:acyl-CoA dehydrogenase [Alphaproteobacteria bacterium]